MLEDKVAELYALEKKYWWHKKVLATLARKIAACTNPVVSISPQNEAFLLQSNAKGDGKRGDGPPEIIVTPIDHGRLVSFVVKEFVLGDLYLKNRAALDAITQTRWDLFKETVTLASIVPQTEVWPKPESPDTTRVLEYAMKLVYRPIRVGFTKKPKLVWCFDGFDY